MSKITFRADDDLVERIEALDASKSEVMREALRTYLDSEARERALAGDEPAASTPDEGPTTLDDALLERVDELVADRLDARLGSRSDARRGGPDARDVNVNVTLEDARGGSSDSAAEVEEGRETRKTRGDAPTPEATGNADRRTCGQCGDEVDAGHVYCPNCGEKATHRVFCDCGDELRSDWAFCPGCGRRTPAADVLDNP